MHNLVRIRLSINRAELGECLWLVETHRALNGGKKDKGSESEFGSRFRIGLQRLDESVSTALPTFAVEGKVAEEFFPDFAVDQRLLAKLLHERAYECIELSGVLCVVRIASGQLARPLLVQTEKRIQVLDVDGELSVFTDELAICRKNVRLRCCCFVLFRCCLSAATPRLKRVGQVSDNLKLLDGKLNIG